MKKFQILILVLFILFSSSYAQELTEGSSNKLEQPVEIPFQLINNHIYIQGFLNNSKDTLNFVFDTGSATVVFNSSLAEKYGLKHTAFNTVGPDSSGSAISHGLLDLLQFGKVKLSGSFALFVNMDQLSNNKFHGIIGKDLLDKYVTKIDYNTKTITFYNSIEECKSVYAEQFRLDFGFQSPQTEVVVRLKNGRIYKGNAILDTGNSGDFTLTSNFVLDNNLLPEFSKKQERISKSLGGATTTYESTVEKVSFAGNEFFDVPVNIFADTVEANNIKSFMANIGNGILKRKNWIFDYANKTAYFEDNLYSSTPFKYSYTDFSIIKKDNNLVFASVQPRSKTSMKGIKNGMIIKTVNGLGIADAKDIYKLLDTAGNKLKIRFINKTGRLKTFKTKTGRKI